MKKLIVLFILPFFFFMGCNLGEGEEVSTIDVETEVDQNSLSVVGITPFNGEGNVALDTNITVVFDNSIDAGTLTSSSYSVVKDDGTVVTGTFLENNYSIIFDPTLLLEVNTTYHVNINKDLHDLNANRLINVYTSNFTTISTAPILPDLVSVFPANNSQGIWINQKITFTFSEAINGANAQMCDIRDSNNTQYTDWTYEYVGTDGISVIPTNSMWATNETYTLTCGSGIVDLDGNAIANNFTTSFSTTKVANLRNMTTVAGISTSSFGTSISISGNGLIIAVGAPTYTAFELNDGLVVTYYKDPYSTWRLNDEIPYYPVVGTPAAGGGENFGFSVSLNFDASYTFFSAPGYLDTTTTYDNAGMVAQAGVIDLTGYTGAPTLIKANTGLPNAFFGKKVVSSEGVIADSLVYAIAEPGYNNSGILGRINIYTYDFATYSYVNSPIDLQDLYSYNLDSLAISGDYGTLIGFQDTYAVPAQVKLYKKDPTYGWVNSTSLQSNPTADIGHVISISDDATMIATGTNGADNPIFIFEWDGASWNQTHALRPTDLPVNSYFGLDLALSGDKNTLLVGAPKADGWAGRVYHYTRNSIDNTWSIKHTYTEPNPVINNLFGSKVATDNNGRTFVIANKAAAGVDSQVYVYEE